MVLAEEPLPSPDARRPLVRNLHTLIYPGRDLELQEDSEAEGRWHDLGCIAIGVVESEAESPAPGRGRVILWNGPHADYALFDPAHHTGVPVGAEPNPDLLLAAILAEAEIGLCADGGNESSPRPFEGLHYAVLGQGLLGHLAAQHLRLAGAHVTVIENSPKRLEFSKYLGLTNRIDLHNLNWAEKLLRWNPDGLDGFIDATGTPGPALDVLRHVRRGGHFGLVGPWRPRLAGGSLPAEIRSVCEKADIRCTPPGPLFGGSPEHAASAAAWVRRIEAGEVLTDRLITKRIVPGEAAMDVKRLVAGVRSILGVIITWDGRESAGTD